MLVILVLCDVYFIVYVCTGNGRNGQYNDCASLGLLLFLLTFRRKKFLVTESIIVKRLTRRSCDCEMNFLTTNRKSPKNHTKIFFKGEKKG